jgi:hypothetical protein
VAQTEPQPGYVGAPPSEPLWGSGATGTGGDTPRSRSRVGIVVVAVLVIALIAAVVWALTRDDDDESGPAQVVAEFFAAAKAGDCQGMLDLMTEETWQEQPELTAEQAIEDCESEMESGEPTFESLEVGNIEVVSETDDTATVSVELTLLEQSATDEVMLIRRDGVWMVHMPGM